jgi:hypothetical protein
VRPSAPLALATMMAALLLVKWALFRRDATEADPTPPSVMNSAYSRGQVGVCMWVWVCRCVVWVGVYHSVGCVCGCGVCVCVCAVYGVCVLGC